MGRGNVCVNGKYEGLYYMDNDDLRFYRRNNPVAGESETRLLRDLNYADLTSGEWEMDEEESMYEEDCILEWFIDGFSKMFPSFERVKETKWINDSRVIVENGLFYIAIEDNEWSLAVKLLQKEEPWGLVWMENLQKRLYQKYLNGMKKVLLNILPSIGTYNYKGAWTSGVIQKGE